MMRRLWIAVLGALAASCSGEEVALNERLFAVSSMASVGAGCTLFELGSGNQESSGAGVLGFAVVQRLDGDRVSVSVSEGGTLLSVRQYDQTFFQSGAVDELSVPSTAGTDMLLRHWGKLHPGGTAGCTPLDASGPK